MSHPMFGKVIGGGKFPHSDCRHVNEQGYRCSLKTDHAGPHKFDNPNPGGVRRK